MADERDEDRERQHDQLFRGTVARGEVFDSLDAIGALDDEPPPAPAARAAPPAAAPERGPTGATSAVDPGDVPVPSTPRAEPERVADHAPPGPARPRPAPRPSVPPSSVLSAPTTARRRVLTIVATALAIVGTFLVVFPFDVSAGEVTARCGPPVFEVLVPSDAAFDVPENTLCGPPAQHRLILGAVFLVAFLGLALAHQWSVRAPRRRARKARRARAHAAKHPTPASSGRRRGPPTPAGTGGAATAPR